MNIFKYFKKKPKIEPIIDVSVNNPIIPQIYSIDIKQIKNINITFK